MDDLQVLQNYKAARIILDLPPHTSSCDTQVKLHWKPPMYCTEQLSTVPFLFINQLITFFLVPLNFVLIVIFIHDYNSQFRNNLRKTTAKRRWGHWTSINFAANEWNSLDLSLREDASLSSFKQNLSKVTLKIPVNE